MTESEAKTKWCPMVDRASDCGNADADGERRTVYCIGSKCMMWRWSMTPEEAIGNKHGPQGFCGLAGKP